MLAYTSILTTFLILFNSFAIGKIIQRNYFTLSSNLAFFAGFIIYYIIYSLAYVPFILIEDLREYYLYTLLIIQILMVLMYVFSYKSFFISFVFNYKSVVSSLISIGTLFICYYLFFVRLDTNQISNLIFRSDWIKPDTNSFSIAYSQLLEFFENLKISTHDFNFFQKIMFPIIIILVSSSMINEFYLIKNFKNIKEIITLFFISFLLGFFIFNIKKINLEKSYFYENLFTDSLAILMFFYVTNVFLKKDINIENQPYFLVLNAGLIFLVFINSSFIAVSLIIFILSVIFICFKRINFGANALIESSIFMLGSICVFSLSQYSIHDTASIIIFSLILSACIVLFSIFYILKKNNSKTTYWPFMQKASLKINKYFRFFYFTIFVILSIVVIVNLISKLFKKEEIENFFNDINLYKLLINAINYNASEKTKDFTNYTFVAFYFILLLMSFWYVWKRKDKYNSNLLQFSLSYFFVFNPFFMYQISNFSNLWIQDGSSYDFSLIFKLLLIYIFSYISYSFKEMEFIKLDFQFINNMNLQTNNTYKNIRFQKFVYSVKKPIYITKNIFSQLIENDYFKFALYSTLMGFFAISIFVCNFT